jgi:hypothetical protein
MTKYSSNSGIQAGGSTLRSEIYKLSTSFEIRMNCHSTGRSVLLYIFIEGVTDLTVVIL